MLNRGLRQLAFFALLLLGVRVLWLILANYVWYFPPNFEQSSFLLGREGSFYGLYATAFYAHIICGPIVLVSATLLFFSGSGEKIAGRKLSWRWHRPLGKLTALIVLLGVVPSGFVMASGTLFGPVATLGFQLHAVGTFICCMAAVRAARERRNSSHRVWAGRCLLLLYGPLVFRIVSGLAIVLDMESTTLYVFNAWASWLVPFCALELFFLRKRRADRTNRLASFSQIDFVERKGVSP